MLTCHGSLVLQFKGEIGIEKLVPLQNCRMANAKRQLLHFRKATITLRIATTFLTIAFLSKRMFLFGPHDVLKLKALQANTANNDLSFPTVSDLVQIENRFKVFTVCNNYLGGGKYTPGVTNVRKRA